MAGVASKIERVTVFLQGAMLTRRAQAPVCKGNSSVLLDGLAGSILPQSVTVTVERGAVLLRANYGVNPLAPAQDTPRRQELEKLLEDNADKLAELADQLALLEAEETFLLHNQAVGGESGITLEKLVGLEAHNRARRAEILAGRRAGVKAQAELEKEHSRLQNALDNLQSARERPTSEIQLELQAEEEGVADISFQYFVHDAQWTPAYELRVKDTNSPVQLLCAGQVSQTTGEDWRAVELTLSSGMPTLGGSHPTLNPWYLDFAQQARSMGAFNARRVMKMAESDMICDEEICAEPPMMAQAEVVQQAASVEFVLPLPETVPSQSEAQRVEFAQHMLEARYRYYSVRKLDKDVFLLAAVRGWEALNLLEGEAAVMLGSTYVGTTLIDPRRAEEELELSLGRDSGVVVTRVRGKDFTAKTMLGGSLKESRQWVTTVRNTKSIPVDIQVLDQIPVSVNKSIVVEPEEVSGAELNEDTGRLCWEFTVQPGQAVEKAVKYTVAYPKGTTVYLE